MIIRPAKLNNRIKAFLLDLLTWVSVIYAFDKIYGHQSFFSGTLLGVIFMVVLNLFLMTRATTLGKFIIDLKVVDRRNGRDFTFVQMIFRETIGKFVSAAIFLIGFIWIIIDNENAGWHDKIFNSMVVEMAKKSQKSICHPDDDEFFVKG